MLLISWEEMLGFKETSQSIEFPMLQGPTLTHKAPVHFFFKNERWSENSETLSELRSDLKAFPKIPRYIFL